MVGLHVQLDDVGSGRHELTHGSAEEDQTRDRDHGDERENQPELNQALGAPVAGKNDHVRYLPVLGSTQYVLCRTGLAGKIAHLGHPDRGMGQN